MFPIATYIKGEALSITTGTGSEETSIKPDINVGKLVGISINRAYTDQIMSQILLTLRQGKSDLLEAVPADYFIPTSDRPYFPIRNILNGVDEIKVTVQSLSASTLAAVEPYLVFHYSDNPNC